MTLLSRQLSRLSRHVIRSAPVSSDVIRSITSACSVHSCSSCRPHFQAASRLMQLQVKSSVQMRLQSDVMTMRSSKSSTCTFFKQGTACSCLSCLLKCKLHLSRRKQQLPHTQTRPCFGLTMCLCRNGALIDATRKGNDARFINHSCEPNCQAEYWTVEGRECVAIFTVHTIKAGEEITYDYHSICAGEPVVT